MIFMISLDLLRDELGSMSQNSALRILRINLVVLTVEHTRKSYQAVVDILCRLHSTSLEKVVLDISGRRLGDFSSLDLERLGHAFFGGNPLLQERRVQLSLRVQVGRVPFEDVERALKHRLAVLVKDGRLEIVDNSDWWRTD